MAEVQPPKRVLVVDDHEDCADSLAQLLDLRGYESAVAYDGLQAIALAREAPPRAVILDIAMPRMNGFEACSRLRELPFGKDLFIIALTGWVRQTDLTEAWRVGFDAFLSKPALSETLIALLERHSTEGPGRVGVVRVRGADFGDWPVTTHLGSDVPMFAGAEPGLTRSRLADASVSGS